MNKKFTTEKLNVEFWGEDNVEVSFTALESEDGIGLYKIVFDFESAVSPKPIRMKFSQGCNDMHAHWDPNIRRQSYVPWGNGKAFESRLASWLPLEQFSSKTGKNRCTIAVSDVKTPIRLASNVGMPSFLIDTEISFFTALISPISHYEAILRLDKRDVAYDTALMDATKWYGSLGYENDYVPDACYDSVYSTWYSYMQDIKAKDALKECRAAKKVGMDTIIVDDGWQNKKILRDYSNCGDWIPAKNRFPDMRAFVDEVHAIGMKAMLWFSVPFMGWDAENFKRFKGKYLYDFDVVRCSVLDPRYKEVREFLIEKYVKAVKEWDYDGLKLDFIDRFRSNGVVTDEMDHTSVEDATETLLREINEALRAVKKDVLIEFRQPYMGPVISTYGNMIRVWDCPEDAHTNRTAIAHLRLTSGKTAVHSDMVVWNYDDTEESVATHLYSTLFSVPQISVRMNNLSKSHRQVLSAFLKFRNEHKDTLMKGEFAVKHFEANYAYTEASLNGERIAVTMSSPIFRLNADYTDDYMVNLSGEDELFIAGDKDDVKYEIFDCTGKRLCRPTKLKKNTTSLTVPNAGIVHIIR